MAIKDRQLSCADYHVAWICPKSENELLPARLMLDEELPTPPYDTHYDENTYICGTINDHTVVIATCPRGDTGNVNAGRLTGVMFKTFPNIQMAVLVGIGGGVPSSTISQNALKNIHLGDVVVGCPGEGKPACVSYDQGGSKANWQFESVGTMQRSDWRLRNALSILPVDNIMGQTTFGDQLSRLWKYGKDRFAHPGLQHDRLFKAGYHHTGIYGSRCVACDESELVDRPQRTEEDRHKLVFHLGRIANTNTGIRDGELRDKMRDCGGVICIETEASGVDINRQCLVIRGISDYADSHKSDIWESHAAGNAAALTRALLCRIIVARESPSPSGEALGMQMKLSGSSNERTAVASISQRFKENSQKIVKVPKSGNLWSPEEDRMLREIMKTTESPKWKQVAEHFQRDDWACQKRYEKLKKRDKTP